MPRRRSSPLRRLSPALVVLAIAPIACSPKGVAAGDLAAIEPPEDLAELDLAVREQFETTWGKLQRLEGGGAPDQNSLGAAWGALGQWFDVYGYDESARRSYSNAQILDPHEPRWPYYLGIVAERSGDLAAAEERFQRAAELAPAELAPRVRLADLALNRQDLDRAEAIYREVLVESPENPAALVGAGRVALLRDDPETAVTTFELVLESQPEASEVHYSLALAWRKLGDEERAREHLDFVPAENLHQIALDRDAPWDRELKQLDQGALKLTRLGVRARRQGRHRDAVALLGRAVAADPDGPEKHINYGLALRGVGRSAAALQEFRTAAELAEAGSENAARAHLEMGRLLAASKEWVSAEEALRRALETDPRSVPAHAELGRVLHWQGRLEEARVHYAEVRVLDPSSASAGFWHAALLAALGQRTDAIRALETDLERLGPSEATRNLSGLLARLLCATETPEPQDIERAVTLVAGSAGTTPGAFWAETQAMVAAARGRFDDAVAWQRSAVSALVGQRPRSAAQIARRRLVLYERDEPAGLPWEAQEVPLEEPVEVP